MPSYTETMQTINKYEFSVPFYKNPNTNIYMAKYEQVTIRNGPQESGYEVFFPPFSTQPVRKGIALTSKLRIRQIELN